MSLFFSDLSTTTFIYSFVIRSALRVLAPKLIDNATNSLPTYYSGKLTINFINKSMYSVKAKVILIFSSKLNRYKRTIATNLKFGTLRSSTIFGIKPAYSAYSLIVLSKHKFLINPSDN